MIRMNYHLNLKEVIESGNVTGVEMMEIIVRKDGESSEF